MGLAWCQQEIDHPPGRIANTDDLRSKATA
jgi:hypothetical protein